MITNSKLTRYKLMDNRIHTIRLNLNDLAQQIEIQTKITDIRLDRIELALNIENGKSDAIDAFREALELQEKLRQESNDD